MNLSDQAPFDCRTNHKATFDDISPVLMEDHLRKTGSKQNYMPKVSKKKLEKAVEKKISKIHR